jgi:hypothetical protein
MLTVNLVPDMIRWEHFPIRFINGAIPEWGDGLLPKVQLDILEATGHLLCLSSPSNVS